MLYIYSYTHKTPRVGLYQSSLLDMWNNIQERVRPEETQYDCKTSTKQMDMSTLWDITPTNGRYFTFIDHIDPEQTQPRPERFFKIGPKINKTDEPIEIPLEKIGTAADPRPGVGIYKKIKSTPRKIKDKDVPACFPAADTPDIPPFIIKEKDNSLTYIPDQLAEDLMKNLIKFMDEHPSTEIIFEEEKNEENVQEHSNTPENKFPNWRFSWYFNRWVMAHFGHDRRNSSTRGHIPHTPWRF